MLFRSGVSAFVQPNGYFLAALGPFLVGFAFEVLGDWRPILVALALTSVVLVWAGFVASRPRLIDEELRSS